MWEKEEGVRMGHREVAGVWEDAIFIGEDRAQGSGWCVERDAVVCHTSHTHRWQ